MPHYGAFDTSIDSIFDISMDTSIDISIFDILCLPHCGEFDIRVCQIPTIAPYNPEGGVVGEYIDRCIRCFVAMMTSYFRYLVFLEAFEDGSPQYSLYASTTHETEEWIIVLQQATCVCVHL